MHEVLSSREAGSLTAMANVTCFRAELLQGVTLSRMHPRSDGSDEFRGMPCRLRLPRAATTPVGRSHNGQHMVDEPKNRNRNCSASLSMQDFPLRSSARHRAKRATACSSDTAVTRKEHSTMSERLPLASSAVRSDVAGGAEPNESRLEPPSSPSRRDSSPSSGPVPVNPSELPSHIAVVMDGNARWAEKRGLPTVMGHERGVEAFRRLVRTCYEWGIPAVTVYAFSTENWQRPEAEVSFLLSTMEQVLKADLPELIERGIQLRFIGNLDTLPSGLQRQIHTAMRATRSHTRLVLTVALSYGGRQDIVQACRRLVGAVMDGSISEEAITEELFAQYLDTAWLPAHVARLGEEGSAEGGSHPGGPRAHDGGGTRAGISAGMSPLMASSSSSRDAAGASSRSNGAAINGHHAHATGGMEVAESGGLVAREDSSRLGDSSEGGPAMAGGTGRADASSAASNVLHVGDPDLLIRSSGEQRMSNFLLWQCAYTELYFTDTLWPDFSADDLRDALLAYKARTRRLGRRIP
eukprot:jgi/Mesvir1/19626/Mv25171-RA.1